MKVSKMGVSAGVSDLACTSAAVRLLRSETRSLLLFPFSFGMQNLFRFQHLQHLGRIQAPTTDTDYLCLNNNSVSGYD